MRNMEVIFSKQVLVSIEEYTNALAKYPISNERIEMKVYQMRSTLLSIGKSVCKSRMPIQGLGTIF